MKEETYNKIFTIGTLVYPRCLCQNSFTIEIDEKIINTLLINELAELNSNNFNAVWEYNKEVHMFERKE